MIKIDYKGITMLEAISLVEKIMTTHKAKISADGFSNLDGICGVTNYSIKLSGSGNLFVHLWVDNP